MRQWLRLAALGVIGMSLCLVTLAGCFDAAHGEISVYNGTSVTVSIVFHRGTPTGRSWRQSHRAPLR